MLIAITLMACSGNPADTSGTGSSSVTMALDGLCREVQTPYKGDDKTILADLDVMIADLSSYSVVHWKEYLHDGSDSSIQITVTEVGDPVVATWVEVPSSEWGKYDDLQSCLYEDWIEVPFSAEFAVGGDQAVGVLTSEASGTADGSRGMNLGDTMSLTFSKDWEALVDSNTADETGWGSGPVDVFVQIGPSGMAIEGQSRSVLASLWEGTFE